MATPSLADLYDDALTSGQAIAQGNIKEWREGDKLGRTHELDEIGAFLKVLREEQEAAANASSGGFGIGYVT